MCEKCNNVAVSKLKGCDTMIHDSISKGVLVSPEVENGINDQFQVLRQFPEAKVTLYRRKSQN